MATLAKVMLDATKLIHKDGVVVSGILEPCNLVLIRQSATQSFLDVSNLNGKGLKKWSMLPGGRIKLERAELIKNALVSKVAKLMGGFAFEKFVKQSKGTTKGRLMGSMKVRTLPHNGHCLRVLNAGH